MGAAAPWSTSAWTCGCSAPPRSSASGCATGTAPIPGAQPASWTDAHHLVHWADAGPTDLSNAGTAVRAAPHVVHQRRYAGRLVEATGPRVEWDLPSAPTTGSSPTARRDHQRDPAPHPAGAGGARGMARTPVGKPVGQWTSADSSSLSDLGGEQRGGGGRRRQSPVAAECSSARTVSSRIPVREASSRMSADPVRRSPGGRGCGPTVHRASTDRGRARQTSGGRATRVPAGARVEHVSGASPCGRRPRPPGRDLAGRRSASPHGPEVAAPGRRPCSMGLRPPARARAGPGAPRPTPVANPLDPDRR